MHPSPPRVPVAQAAGAVSCVVRPEGEQSRLMAGTSHTPVQDIQSAVERLRRGGLVAFPTETVYGLGADARSPEAVAAVFRVKGRPAHNPLIVHVSGVEMARTQVVAPGAWSAAAAALARAFWPGPLTLVLPAREELPAAISGLGTTDNGVAAGGGRSVGVRCPDHPTALALLFAFGRPIVGPSANLSGAVSPTRAEHVRSAFDPREVFVLEGGDCQAGIESTVLSLLGAVPRILRPGVIGAEAVARVLGCDVVASTPGGESPQSDQASVPLASPGMLASHYAPKTPAVIVDDVETCLELESVEDSGGRAVVLTHRLVTTVEPPHELIEMPARAAEYAAALYATLRQADARGANLIIVERPPTTAELEVDQVIWGAVADRLRRATAR